MARRRLRGTDLDELLEELDDRSAPDALLRLLPPDIASEVRLGTSLELESEDYEGEDGFAKVWTVKLDRGDWKQRHRLGFTRDTLTPWRLRRALNGFRRRDPADLFDFADLASGGMLDDEQARRFVELASSKGPLASAVRVTPLNVPPGIRGRTADVVIVDDIVDAEEVFGGDDEGEP